MMNTFLGLVRLSLFCLLLYIEQLASAQGAKDFYLVDPGAGDQFKCMKCKTVLDKMPHEVEMGTIISKDNEVLFYMTNPEWLTKLFKNKFDGVAIDLITKDQYDCHAKNKIKTGFHEGTLLPPVFFKDFATHSRITNGIFYLKIADLPAAFIGKEVEGNYMIVQDNYVCHYETNFNIQAYGWDLLDMGMYSDSIVYRHTIQNVKKDSLSKTQPAIFDKRMKFIIPFEKGKYDYVTDDFKPIYDSLNLTDYVIQAITIKAYSSVEGSETKNIELQEKRAESIAKAMQSYQQPHINTAIYASENWVEFYYDVSNNIAFKYLTPYSKEEVKQKLQSDKKMIEELEVFFKNHRKAILVIELNRRNKLSEVKPAELITLFDEAIEQKNINRALEIQRTVFRRISDHELPDSFMTQLTVPKKIEYNQLLINQASFNYKRNTNHYAAYLEFQELEDLLPTDGRIKYNLCVLMFKLLKDGEYVVPIEELNVSISKLTSFSIPAPLIDRMMINYNILLSEYYMQKGNYHQKDKCLTYIEDHYMSIPMNDLDLVCLAQYMSRYTMYDWAAALLQSRVNKVDVEEDLLFYYINLALGRPINEEFKGILLNALNADHDRYCNMFKSVKNGGASFQLLSDKVLKNIYCENCQ